MNVSMREAHGWFGIPWPSYVCYTDNGELLNNMHKAFPIGERCIFCDEIFNELAGDSGVAIPQMGMDGTVIRHIHKECLIADILGAADIRAKSKRDSAILAWQHITGE